MAKRTFKLEKVEDIAKVGQYLRSLVYKKPWYVTIDNNEETRSLKQNKLLMFWMNYISKSRLETHGEYLHPEGLKEWFKELFLGQTACMLDERVVVYTRSTSDLKVKEFSEFLNQIEIYAVIKLSIVLPRPDDYYWEAMGIKRST